MSLDRSWGVRPMTDGSTSEDMSGGVSGERERDGEVRSQGDL